MLVVIEGQSRPYMNLPPSGGFCESNQPKTAFVGDLGG